MTKLCFEVLNEAFCRDAEAFSEPSEKDLEWQNKMTTTEWVKIFSKFTIWAIFFAVQICHQIESYLKQIYRPPSTTPTMFEEDRHDRHPFEMIIISAKLKNLKLKPKKHHKKQLKQNKYS